LKRRKTWFYRSLFAYLPIFFVATLILYLTFFAILGEITKKTALKANEALGVQVAQSVDNMLLTIDKVVIKDIMSDDTNYRFFHMEDGLFGVYASNRSLNRTIASFPEIESIYLVRYADGMVVTDTGLSSADEFVDAPFIKAQRDAGKIVYWSGKRTFDNPRRNTTRDVVTLVRRVPVTGESKGLFVVNVRADAISAMVSRMTNAGVNSIRIKDGSGGTIYQTGDSSDANRHTSSVPLSYTGWSIESGINVGYANLVFASFPYVWASVGIISIFFGGILIVYVTRKRYKPIESIVSSIRGGVQEQYFELFHGAPQDEMRYIQLAIDQLLENAYRYENMHKEDQHILRRHLFGELLEGIQSMQTEECRNELHRLGIRTEFERASVAVLEIDKYADFCANYSAKDQYLLRYVIVNVIHEIASNQGISVWAEYVEGSRLGIIVFEEPGSLLEKTLQWSEKHLKISFTIGFGGVTSRAEELPTLYENAKETLEYKAILGSGRIIDETHLPNRSPSDVFEHVPLVHALARSYRLGEPGWEEKYERLFSEMKAQRLPVDDVVKILHYALSSLDYEIHELPEPIQERWKATAYRDWQDALQRFDILEEFRERAFTSLRATFDDILSVRENRINNELIHRMKKYIEENYFNPDLSLYHLSDEFNLSTRYLSKLFKDEFGEKFVDYLVRIRMERAKSLLLETNETVQDVAAKVGYLHSFSFIRMFKKVAGVTPGDYRK